MATFACAKCIAVMTKKISRSRLTKKNKFMLFQVYYYICIRDAVAAMNPCGLSAICR